MSRGQLEPQRVAKARQDEMEFFRNMHAYTRCPRACIEAEKGKLSDVRWIDTNKGDTANPNDRSRLVGREFNTHRDDALYAATPHLEAQWLIISHAATIRRGGGHGGQWRREMHRYVMINDVSRAYVYAPATRSLFVELPVEDGSAKPAEVGRLNVCLYGTRDAAKEWH